ncbi:MAG: LytTR family DNA-binding domain-containing protein [Saprospiraceae bacterium]|nr:response regulator transcription factor [Lewinella sp.]
MVNTIKALVIDDEKHARDALRALLELYCPEVDVVGEAANLIAAQESLIALHPNLLFLDIAIGEDSGFDLLEDIPAEGVQVIFTTAHSEFAVRAFRVNALDYLLKPIEPEQLQQAVAKARQSSIGINSQQLSVLARAIQQQSLRQLAIPSLEGVTFLEIDDIIRIEGSGNYSTFHTATGEQVISSKNIGHYEELLPQDLFFRCHQSHLINIRSIKKILTADGNIIELKDGQQIPLAGKRKKALLSKLK